MRLAIVACLVGLGGCAAETAEDPGRSWRYAEARADCAPWDGAATTVLLSDSALTGEARMPYLRLSAWVPLPQGEVRAEVEAANAGGLAASLCEAGVDCDHADRGWVRLVPVNGEIQGHYQLHLAGGRTIVGSFTAPVRTDRQVLCG